MIQEEDGRKCDVYWVLIMWQALWQRRSQAPFGALFLARWLVRENEIWTGQQGSMEQEAEREQVWSEIWEPIPDSILTSCDFCSSHLITFLACKTCIISVQVIVRINWNNVSKVSGTLDAILRKCQFPSRNPSLPAPPHPQNDFPAMAKPESAQNSMKPSC